MYASPSDKFLFKLSSGFMSSKSNLLNNNQNHKGIKSSVMTPSSKSRKQSK